MIAGPALRGSHGTLVAGIYAQAMRVPERDAVRFLAEGEAVTERVSFAGARGRMEAIAAGLARRGLAGRPVILGLPPGVDFVLALIGCFRAGALAVPVPFPALGDALARVNAIVGSVGAAAVLVDAADLGTAKLAPFDGLPCLPLEDVEQHGPLPPLPAPDDPALIQYSSGSTREPRGIVITQGNLAANEAMIEAVFEIGEADIGASWLPPSHDMGLIGAILQVFHTGGTAVLMPPTLFLQKPLRWLRAIGDHRATTAGGPNFAYDLCVRRVPSAAVETLDLSSWRVAFCGAEPIRAETLRRFAGHFAPAGFDARAFLPCYGLAEATLIATGRRPGKGIVEVALPAGAAAFRPVSCGAPAPGCTVALRPTEGLPADTGEIGLAGPHISPGTWDGASGTVVPFADTFAGADGARFLATGDAGALVDGELLVFDRLKDIVAAHGRKIHAIDIEHAAIAADGAVAAAAAFSVPGTPSDPERAVLLCELPARDLARIDDARRRSIARGVSERTGLAPEIEFLRHGALPRTTSGKIRRHAARAAYLAGTIGRPRP